MKFLTYMIFGFFVISNNLYAEMTFSELMKQKERESQEFNKTVTNEEIIEYLEAFFKYRPNDLKDLTNQTDKERSNFLKNYRKSYTDAGMQIPTLKGFTQEEKIQFDNLAKFKAEESIRIASATKRLLSFSNAQYKLMISESKKLISNYKDMNQNSDSSKRILIEKNFPKELSFLDLETIYLYPTHCELLLQNGIGKDIGYIIKTGKTDNWIIESFNHYLSWESTEIKILN